MNVKSIGLFSSFSLTRHPPFVTYLFFSVIFLNSGRLFLSCQFSSLTKAILHNSLRRISLKFPRLIGGSYEINDCVIVFNRGKRTFSTRILSARRNHGNRGISMWGTRIWSPFNPKPDWSARNQWKSSLPETGFSGVSRRGEDGSETQTVAADFGTVQLVLITLSFSSRPMCSSSCAFCHFSFCPKLIASRAQSVSNTSSTSILSQIDLVTNTMSLYNVPSR